MCVCVCVCVCVCLCVCLCVRACVHLKNERRTLAVFLKMFLPLFTHRFEQTLRREQPGMLLALEHCVHAYSEILHSWGMHNAAVAVS